MRLSPDHLSASAFTLALSIGVGVLFPSNAVAQPRLSPTPGLTGYESVGRYVVPTHRPAAARATTPPPYHVREGHGACTDGVKGQQATVIGYAASNSPQVYIIEQDGSIALSQVSVPAVLTDDLGLNKVHLPGFIRRDFLFRLSSLSPDQRKRFVSVVAGLPVNHQDEAAWLVAHIPLEELLSTKFDDHMLIETPQHIYEAAASGKLPYVKLVEIPGADGEPKSTTLSYHLKLKDGTDAWKQLPPELYYEYVVSLKLDFEGIETIAPGMGMAAHPPLGVDWREYYMFTPENVGQYTDHFLFRNPKKVDDAELQSWGPSATTVFAPWDVGPLELASSPKGLVAMEFRVGKGTIIATTMPIEHAEAVGKSSILNNFLYYGNGNIKDHVGAKHLVIRDRAPSGTDALAKALDALHVNYEIVDSTAFAGGADLTDVVKIIVAEDQPKSLLEAVASRKADLEKWLDTGTGNVLEVHGSTRQADDWAGVVLPGGFTTKPMTGNSSDEVTIGGWPSLQSVMDGTELMWDSVSSKGLSGSRVLTKQMTALDRLGWFTGQNLFDNVSEYRKKHGGNVERSTQSARVLFNHYGNCGEIQDVLTSAGRSALVPVRNVGSLNEDHVWNEFFSLEDQTWKPFQVSWSDEVTIIAEGNGSMEKKFGGGKDISAVPGFREDGLLTNETSSYTDTWTMHMQVTDKAGTPIDGAMVLLASEGFYPNGDGTYPLGIGLFGYTDAQGKLDWKLGDKQNYYVRVETPYGTFPAEANKVTQIATEEETVPGWKKDVPVQIDATAPKPTAITLPATAADGDPTRHVSISIESLGRYLMSKSPIGDEHAQVRRGDGNVSLYAMDEAAYGQWTEGKTVEALWGAEGLTGEKALCGDLAPSGKTFIVVTDTSQLQVGSAFLANFTFVRTAPPETPDGGVDDAGGQQTDAAPSDTTEETTTTDGGCSCTIPSTGARHGWTGLFWLALGASLWNARRRRNSHEG